MHKEGLSCSEIGNALGFSRNAIIGKLFRSGLRDKGYTEGYRPARKNGGRNAKDTTFHPPRTRRPRRTFTNAVNGQPFEPYPELIDTVAVPPDTMVQCSLQDLTLHTCRFPHGDPLKPGFFYCGNPTYSRLPYCKAHARIAYLTAAQARANRRNFYAAKAKNR
jgi:GcrA cell cycle regulator